MTSAIAVAWALVGLGAPAGALPFTETVQVSSADTDGESTLLPLQAGVTYTFTMTNTYWFDQAGGGQADAECTSTAADPTWLPDRFVAAAPNDDLADVYVNGSKVDWHPVTGVACNTQDHTYTLVYAPQTTGTVNFNVADPNKGDNVGSLTVTIKEGADTDADGIFDADDNCPSVANPNQEDGDGDGTGDACDAFPTDPDNDADGDGIAGDVDNCPDVANPDQADQDQDDTGDACDSDRDGDGVANGSDAFPDDPAEWSDPDADSVGDNTDNCPSVANPEQEDTDGDGLGNACDAFPDDPANDADGDGIDAAGDDADNCPDIANADQADLDGDRTGDACDPDRDGDGVVNEADAFPNDPAESADTDGDGVGDNSDNCPSISNADQADANGDGTGDACSPVPPPAWSRVEENRAGVTYTGSKWSTVSSSSASGGSLKRTKVQGRKASFTFTGDGVRWIGVSSPTSGIVSVSIDGRWVTAVDAYAASTTNQKILFERTGLAPGRHTLELRITGNKNRSSNGAYGNVDAFEYRS